MIQKQSSMKKMFSAIVYKTFSLSFSFAYKKQQKKVGRAFKRFSSACPPQPGPPSALAAGRTAALLTADST